MTQQHLHQLLKSGELEKRILEVIQNAPYGITQTRIAQQVGIPYNHPDFQEMLWKLCNKPPFILIKIGFRYAVGENHP